MNYTFITLFSPSSGTVARQKKKPCVHSVSTPWQPRGLGGQHAAPRLEKERENPLSSWGRQIFSKVGSPRSFEPVLELSEVKEGQMDGRRDSAARKCNLLDGERATQRRLRVAERSDVKVNHREGKKTPQTSGAVQEFGCMSQPPCGSAPAVN